MKQLLAVCGDHYHPSEPIKEALTKALAHSALKQKYAIRYIEPSELVDALNDKPDCVILSKENRLNPTDDIVTSWMTIEIETAIANYVNEGGSWLAWHSGLASYQPGSPFTNMLRGYFEYHPEKHQQVTYNRKGSEDALTFTILDEHYFVYCDVANTDVFLRSESIDGQSIAGWRHSYGNGRVSCYAPAHRREGLNHQMVISLLVENIAWCCNDNE
ncbi:ThuA domain-containing protein [Halalkalibacter kiskunsagensis]|uniref:ThuA domain-containing protein n=1 Tax=Halalkalibacter kiskunsagensis TaxID=1548599 RepID=A0ABV6KBT6_9BACI